MGNVACCVRSDADMDPRPLYTEPRARVTEKSKSSSKKPDKEVTDSANVAVSAMSSSTMGTAYTANSRRSPKSDKRRSPRSGQKSDKLAGNSDDSSGSNNANRRLVDDNRARRDASEHHRSTVNTAVYDRGIGRHRVGDLDKTSPFATPKRSGRARNGTAFNSGSPKSSASGKSSRKSGRSHKSDGSGAAVQRSMTHSPSAGEMGDIEEPGKKPRDLTPSVPYVRYTNRAPSDVPARVESCSQEFEKIPNSYVEVKRMDRGVDYVSRSESHSDDGDRKDLELRDDGSDFDGLSVELDSISHRSVRDENSLVETDVKDLRDLAGSRQTQADSLVFTDAANDDGSESSSVVDETPRAVPRLIILKRGAASMSPRSDQNNEDEEEKFETPRGKAGVLTAFSTAHSIKADHVHSFPVLMNSAYSWETESGGTQPIEA